MGLVICHSNKAQIERGREKSGREKLQKTDKISAGALVQQKPDRFHRAI